jgi:hypothetical protein
MKTIAVLIFLVTNSVAGSVPAPVTPDAGSTDTSVMGGGTPGNQGINTLDINEPDQERLDKMRGKKEKQEPRKRKIDKTNLKKK